MTFEVRPVAPGEHGEAGEVTLAAYRSLPVDLGEGYAEELRDVARRTTGATVLVAVEDGRVLGTVTLVDDPGSPWSESLAPGELGVRMLGVRPDARGRGVGTALLAAGLERGRALGKRRAVLHSTEVMTVAHRIYCRAGFERAPHRDVAYPGFELMAFTLELG